MVAGHKYYEGANFWQLLAFFDNSDLKDIGSQQITIIHLFSKCSALKISFGDC